MKTKKVYFFSNIKISNLFIESFVEVFLIKIFKKIIILRIF